jgi:hypothetical protein
MVELGVHGDVLQLRVRSPGGSPSRRPALDTEQVIRDRVDAFGGDLTVSCLADEAVVTATLPLNVPTDVVPALTGAEKSTVGGGRR